LNYTVPVFLINRFAEPGLYKTKYIHLYKIPTPLLFLKPTTRSAVVVIHIQGVI